MADLECDDERLRELALFAGSGGGILGGHLLGWRTICAVEQDAYAAGVLAARQNDGFLPPFPIWDDVRTFDGFAWRGRVDVVSGGFPCQDISFAGRGAGIDGTRSGLWSAMAQIICEVGPRFVFVENSPALCSRGLDRVLRDLAEMGFDARWGCVSAADSIWAAGTPCLDHLRERIWVVATANPNRHGQLQPGRDLTEVGRRAGHSHTTSANPNSVDGDQGRNVDGSQWKANDWGSGAATANATGQRRREMPERQLAESVARRNPDVISNSQQVQAWPSRQNHWWATEPIVGGVADGDAAALDIHGAAAVGGVDRLADGVCRRIDRLRCIGNAQSPAAAALAWRLLGGPVRRMSDGD